MSYSGHYFDTYTAGPFPLLGQSYEYLCHICQPSRDNDTSDPVDPTRDISNSYCTLNNFQQRFTDMSRNRNNVIRLQTIFNHSPGYAECGPPFDDEQPFVRSGDKWDLNPPPGSPPFNETYFDNLDAVVGWAYNNNIVVEVTLFNPWDGNWMTGPFYYKNTVGQAQGFREPGLFMTLKNCVTDCSSASQQQNAAARDAQVRALTHVVMRLKKYPNVIYEVANEPDFIQVGGVLPKDVLAWEQYMISAIIAEDQKAPTPGKHLIQLNGQYQNASDSSDNTFAWHPKDPSQPNGPLTADVETAHYPKLNTPRFPPANTPNPPPAIPPTFYGALEILQSTDPDIIKGRAKMPIGFNEDFPLPDSTPHRTNRDDNDVRSEALEFIMHGGATFDGYSQNYNNQGAKNLSAQLGYLFSIVYPQGTVGSGWFDAMVPVDCSQGCWVSGIPASGNPDVGDCPVPGGANIYWSTIQQGPYFTFTLADKLLYVHHGQQLTFPFGGYKAIACTVPNDPTKGYHLTGLQYSTQTRGCYQEYWQDPATGLALHFTTRDLPANQQQPIAYNPTYAQDVLLFLELLGTGTCSGGTPLTAKFSYTCNGLSCDFDGSASTPPPPAITAYTWRWGDGSWTGPSSTPTAHHAFSRPGIQVVALEVNDAAGHFNNTGQQVPVKSKAASASFAASCNGLSCTFNGGGSTAGDAPISLYSWIFGDATGFDGTTTTATHGYGGGGLYNVTLTLTDSFGVTVATTQTVTVSGPPMVRFAASCSGLTCTFNASGTTSATPIATYAWTFGDGASGSGVAPTHAYAASGRYTVTLTATDSSGQSGVATATVTVEGPPVAIFTVQCSGMTCTTHTTSYDPDGTQIARYLWNWGDGTPVIEPGLPVPWADQSHTYATAGRYTITHTVYDVAGFSASFQLDVVPNLPPVANNDTATTDRDVPVVIDILANDSDPDGDALSIYNVDLRTYYPGAQFQAVQVNGRWAIKVTPPDSFVGTITFHYQACDNWGACSAPATVTLTVKQWTIVIDAIGQQFWCAQNGSLFIPYATLLANDYDSKGDPLSIVAIDTSYLAGTLDCTSNPNGCSYRPNSYQAGLTYFRYTISDPAGHHSTTTVRIYVGLTPQPPTASNIFYTTPANTAKTFTIQDIWLGTFDQDGNTLSITVGGASYGAMACTRPMYSCTYTPNPGFVGTDTVTYTASDGINPAVTAYLTVLTLPNPTPTFDAREVVIAVAQNQSAYIGSWILASDYAPSGGPIAVQSLDTTGLMGTLSCTASGCTYTPPSYYLGTTAFKYTANDSHGATDTAIVRIRVGGSDTAPVVAAQTLSTPRNTALRFSIFDLLRSSSNANNDPMSVTVFAYGAQFGSLTCTNPQYWCTYTPNPNVTGSDAFTYAVCDNGACTNSTVTINIQ